MRFDTVPARPHSAAALYELVLPSTATPPLPLVVLPHPLRSGKRTHQRRPGGAPSPSFVIDHALERSTSTQMGLGMFVKGWE